MLVTIFLVLVGIGISIWVNRNRPEEDTQTLSKEEKAELRLIYEKVLSRLQDDQYYLNKSLKLSDLSEEIGERERQVSKAINTFEKRNFNSLVNLYRIKHAQAIMEGGEFSFYTIEAIAEESGFSNKVSFYNAFKSEVGMSPSQYRALKQP